MDWFGGGEYGGGGDSSGPKFVYQSKFTVLSPFKPLSLDFSFYTIDLSYFFAKSYTIPAQKEMYNSRPESSSALDVGMVKLAPCPRVRN